MYEEPTVTQSYKSNYETTAPVSQPMDTEMIHKIAESIVNEKWDNFISNVGNIGIWKEKIENEIVSIKQEVVRLQERLENTQNSVMGKVADYDTSIKKVHTEMVALERVFEKILDPLVSNVKELSKITEDLKKYKR